MVSISDSDSDHLGSTPSISTEVSSNGRTTHFECVYIGSIPVTSTIVPVVESQTQRF